MEWIDSNIGSSINMKYPSCILLGEYAKGTTISLHLRVKTLGKMLCKKIHVAPNTTSSIVSKSISRGGGKVNYRGKVVFGKKAKGSKANIECDTIILDDISTSDTIPVNVIKNSDVFLQHEATVSKISEDQLFYLMSRGLTEAEATEMIVMDSLNHLQRTSNEYAVN